MTKEFKNGCLSKFISHKKVMNEKEMEAMMNKISDKIDKKMEETFQFKFKEAFNIDSPNS